MRGGKPSVQSVQVSEKMFLSFDYEATNAGGHSSVPTRDNAIYDLAGALDRLSRYDFPPRFSAVTRAYFADLAQVETGDVAEAAAAVGRGDASESQLAPLSRGPRYK